MQNLTSESELSQLHEDFKSLRLKHWSYLVGKEIADLLPNERAATIRVLKNCLKAEILGRQNSQIAARVRAAKFKPLQTIDQFDFSFNKSTQNIQKPLLSFISAINAENLPSAIFSGTPGLGKTHLAKSIGYHCCQLGMSVGYYRVSDMINQLIHAQKVFRIDSELKRYRKPQVLVLDELGYVSLDTQASNLFFQVVATRHDLGLGTIATTNLPFSKFNQIFSNDAIAHAIVDRLVNESEVYYLEGEKTYRDYLREQRIKKRNQTAQD
jgi:DNA replication protein DnaC